MHFPGSFFFNIWDVSPWRTKLLTRYKSFGILVRMTKKNLTEIIFENFNLKKSQERDSKVSAELSKASFLKPRNANKKEAIDFREIFYHRTKIFKSSLNSQSLNNQLCLFKSETDPWKGLTIVLALTTWTVSLLNSLMKDRENSVFSLNINFRITLLRQTNKQKLWLSKIQNKIYPTAFRFSIWTYSLLRASRSPHLNASITRPFYSKPQNKTLCLLRQNRFSPMFFFFQTNSPPLYFMKTESIRHFSWKDLFI